MISIFKDIVARLKGIYSEPEAKEICYILLEEFVGVNKTDLYLGGNNRAPDKQQIEKLEAAMILLLNHTPVQYVIGHTNFYGYKIHVNPHVLIPRAETEGLVSLFLQKNQNIHPKILDIGSGSGCIPIAIKKELLDSDVYACDFKRDILETVRVNCIENCVDVKLILADILKKEEWSLLPKELDYIISNPPYVLPSEKKEMQKNVLDYEPEYALFVEENSPLIFYDVISDIAKYHLKLGGKLFFEINEMLGKEVNELLQKKHFNRNKVFKDLQGKERYVISEKTVM